MSSFLKNINNVSLNNFLLGLVTFVVYITTVFSAISSNAEVAVAPSSYVAEENDVKLVKGQPEYVDGKKVKYETTHTIPITPKIVTENGKEVSVPTGSKCPVSLIKSGGCSKRLMAR